MSKFTTALVDFIGAYEQMERSRKSENISRNHDENIYLTAALAFAREASAKNEHDALLKKLEKLQQKEPKADVELGTAKTDKVLTAIIEEDSYLDDDKNMDEPKA